MSALPSSYALILLRHHPSASPPPPSAIAHTRSPAHVTIGLCALALPAGVVCLNTPPVACVVCVCVVVPTGTYGGNSVCAAAAVATIDVIRVRRAFRLLGVGMGGGVGGRSVGGSGRHQLCIAASTCFDTWVPLRWCTCGWLDAFRRLLARCSD
jgi:hypothetical protein